MAPVDACLGVLVGGGDDEIGRGKVDLGAVGDAAGFAARHRVAGDKLRPLGQSGLHRLHHAALHAGNIRHHRAGLDQMPVLLDPLQQNSRVQTKDDAIRAGNQCVKILGRTLGNIFMLQGVVDGLAAAGDARYMVAMAAEHLGVSAAQQAQAHDQIGFRFIQHPASPLLGIDFCTQPAQGIPKCGPAFIHGLGPAQQGGQPGGVHCHG